MDGQAEMVNLLRLAWHGWRRSAGKEVVNDGSMV